MAYCCSKFNAYLVEEEKTRLKKIRLHIFDDGVTLTLISHFYGSFSCFFVWRKTHTKKFYAVIVLVTASELSKKQTQMGWTLF